MSASTQFAKATVRCIAVTMLASSLIGCSALTGPKVECHDVTTPIATRDTATGPFIISATLTRRVCSRV